MEQRLERIVLKSEYQLLQKEKENLNDKELKELLLFIND